VAADLVQSAALLGGKEAKGLRPRERFRQEGLAEIELPVAANQG
jgi:hypothetical protein